MKSVSKIEVNFAVPVELSENDQRSIFEIVQRACKRTETEKMVHWAAGCGSKPRFSQTDALFLNVSTDKDAPFDGDPTFDDSVFCIDTCARERYESEPFKAAMAVFSRPECPFNYCDTKAPHDECKEKCRHA